MTGSDDRVRGGALAQMYRHVIRGELDKRFGVPFERISRERRDGTTGLTDEVTDQAHLQGLLQQAQELGLDHISVSPVGPSRPGPQGPNDGERRDP
jgi:hypothetical protein